MVLWAKLLRYPFNDEEQILAQKTPGVPVKESAAPADAHNVAT